MTDPVAKSVNTLYAPNFTFLLSSNKLKNLEFRVQSFTALGITLDEYVRYWNSVQITRPGDTMTFNEASMTILLDEELTILEDLYDYLFRIKDFVENELDDDDWTGTLITATNRNNFNKKFIFKNCWIKSFNDITFTSTETSNTPLTTDISIVYSHYTIENI